MHTHSPKRDTRRGEFAEDPKQCAQARVAALSLSLEKETGESVGGVMKERYKYKERERAPAWCEGTNARTHLPPFRQRFAAAVLKAAGPAAAAAAVAVSATTEEPVDATASIWACSHPRCRCLRWHKNRC